MCKFAVITRQYMYHFPSFPGRLLFWWKYWRLWNVQENYQVCTFYHEYSSNPNPNPNLIPKVATPPTPPKNSDPPKIVPSKLISFFAKITEIIDILTKCHSDQTFLLITLKVQDIHYICAFFQTVFLSDFLGFYFLNCPCEVHVLAIRK